MAIKWTKKPINTNDLIRCAEDALLQKLGVSVHIHPQYYVTGQSNINALCVVVYSE